MFMGIIFVLSQKSVIAIHRFYEYKTWTIWNREESL